MWVMLTWRMRNLNKIFCLRTFIYVAAASCCLSFTVFPLFSSLSPSLYISLFLSLSTHTIRYVCATFACIQICFTNPSSITDSFTEILLGNTRNDLCHEREISQKKLLNCKSFSLVYSYNRFKYKLC